MYGLLTAKETSSLHHSRGGQEMIRRIMRLIRLDFTVFEEIESDPNATTQAVIIVAVTSFLSALGSALGSESAASSAVSTLINGFVGWIVWAVVTYFVGKSLFKAGGTLQEMLRLLGYASAPNILGIFTFIPCLGWLAGFAGWLISLIAGVLAIKEGLDVDLTVAILVVIVGAVAMGVLYTAVAISFEGILAIAAGLFRAVGGQ